MFRKVLVANRGEIAVRILRACREMGISTVAVYSEADRESYHLKLADEAICIGPPAARESYLNQKAILSAARITRAEAIHPGYGFLAENSDFAQACSDWGITFIGPSPQTIRILGNKSQARALAKSCGIPVVPGSEGCVGNDCQKQAERIGFPLMIKAAAGGGGKGLRLVKYPKDLAREVETVQSEAQAAFGDPSFYLEKFIESPRHIEVQIAADSRGEICAAPERDCSVQRRHQKLIEESPSPAVSPALRLKLQEAAIALAREAGYRNVGTVEFLLAPNGEFYFIEVNTRLQVEHPVTEQVTGLDLVVEQIRLAAGENLSFTQETAGRILSHAIEHRINAEDPDRQFAPCPGRLEKFQLPAGPGVRVDTHLYPGYTIPSYYDSLLAKLIAWAPDRPSALERAKRALSEFKIEGISTTLGFHEKVLKNPAFLSGKFDTRLVGQMLNGEKP